MDACLDVYLQPDVYVPDVHMPPESSFSGLARTIYIVCVRELAEKSPKMRL